MNDTADGTPLEELRLGASIDASFIPDGVLIAAALQVEELADKAGWDQPAAVYVALDVRSSSVEMDDAVAERLRAPIADGNEVLAVGLLGQIEGNPREELVGFDAPANAVALALVTESWTMPEDATAEERATMRPSEHPRRVESRDVLVQTADGRLLWCRRQRGEGAPGRVEIDPDGIRGALIDVLRRTIGLGPIDEHDLVGELCTALSGAVTRADMFHRLPHTDPMMLAVLTAYSYTVAATQAAAVEAAENGEAISELTARVIDDTETLLYNANTEAAERWQQGEEWLSDMMLWLVAHIPHRVLARSVASVLLGMDEQTADWWGPSFIAQFVADTYDNHGAAAVVDENEQQRLEQLGADRIRRLAALRDHNPVTGPA